MAKRTGTTNIELGKLIGDLRFLSSRGKVKIWKRIADDLSYSTRRRREVNLDRINRHAKDKEVIVVPGKVLGNGILKKDIIIAAWKFSKDAKDKLGDNAITIYDLMKVNHKGKNVRMIG